MDTDTRTPEHSDEPDVFEALKQRPDIAWPTIILLLSAYAIFGLSSYAYVHGALPLIAAISLNAIAAYLSFTPAHDAAHNAVSANRHLNDWVGRIATALQSPVPFFRTFRYIHMQHHRFTNEHDRDPDKYVASGPRWLLPLRWASLDFAYFHFYFRRGNFLQRPESERRELFLALLFSALIITATALAGAMEYYLLLFLIPQRITAVFLAISFDYLPHYPHTAKGKEHSFQSTSNRVGFEWLLTPVLVYQNYHLVHHLYPTVPFYRYIKVWNAKKQFHASQKPATVDAFKLAPRID